MLRAVMLILLAPLSGANAEPLTARAANPATAEVSLASRAPALGDSCPRATPEDIKGLCSFICDKKRDKKNGNETYPFHYQSHLFKIACTSRDDPEEVMNQKIQAFWKKHQSMLFCDTFGFNVVKGDLIKYGVDNYFDEFVGDVTLWGVDLNKIDPADGKTVLDYVKEEMEKKKGTALEYKLKYYYAILKESGAKHRKDLPASP